MEFEWTIFQDSLHCSSSKKSNNSWTKWPNPNNSKDELSSCRCSMTSYGDKNNETECAANSTLVSFFAKKLSSRTLVIPRTWIRNKMVFHPQWKTWRTMGQSRWIDDESSFGESKHPVFRSTSPLSRGVLKSKGGGKLSIHFCADEGTMETIFRTIISVNQLNIYGVVSDLCGECKSCHVRTARPVVEGQSDPLFVPSVMKTHIHLTDDPAQPEEDLLQQDRVSKFLYWCKIPHHSWSRTVFSWRKTLKNSHNSQNQWPAASYTLPRDESFIWTKRVWIRVNTKIGPVLEVTTCCLQGKYGVEIRIESMNKKPFLLVGQNFLTAWISWSRNLKQQGARRRLCVEIEYTCFCEADQRLKQNHKDVFLPAHPQKTYTYWWKNLGPKLNHKIIRSPITQYRRKLINLLRHGSLPREDDGAINSGDHKIIFRTILCILGIGLMKSGRASWQEETRKDFTIVLIFSGENTYLRALQGQTGRNLIDPALQKQCLDSGRFFKSRRMCNQFYIPSSIQDWYRFCQNLSKRQTVFFLSVNPMEKEHKDPEKIDLEAPRLALVHAYNMEENIKTRCTGSTSNLLKRKD